MAFFCPIRIPKRRRKKREVPDDSIRTSTSSNGVSKHRSTNSNGVDSLLNTGKNNEEELTEFNPEKMVILHDFLPCVEDEVQVKRGQHVKALYRETDWIYVLAGGGKEGFIPFTYCVPLEEYEKHREQQKAGFQRQNVRNSSLQNSTQTLTQTDDAQSWTFVKNNFGEYIVRYRFDASDENDITAKRGEKVVVLNKDDPDWFWVAKKNGIEGFIPKDFLVSMEQVQNGDVSPASTTISSQGSSVEQAITVISGSSTTTVNTSDRGYFDVVANSNGNIRTSSDIEPPGHFRPRRNTNELLLYGQELVCTDTFLGQKVEELTVYKGDWIYADMKHKDGHGYIWAYSPSTKRQGFVPKACLRPPATTPL